MSNKIQTPWGKAQDVIQYRKGFYFYDTAGHGGYFLSYRHNQIIPAQYRIEDGWYEEDCEALKVIYFLSDILMPISKSYIKKELENYLGKKVED